PASSITDPSASPYTTLFRSLPASSGPRIGEFGRTTSSDARIKPTTTDTPAQIIPFFSTGRSVCISSASARELFSSFLSILNAPRRGSTILSDTNQPTSVSKNTLVAMEYQLKATFMESAYAGSITDAPAADSSISIPSVPLSSRLAENPPDTPAKAAARPASGCLPSARYNSAPSGGSTT